MSKRTRSTSWIEGRIIEVLGKTKPGKNPCSLALSSMALNFEVRNIDEQHNYDFALMNLLRNRLVIEDRDEKCFKIYKLAV